MDALNYQEVNINNTKMMEDIPLYETKLLNLLLRCFNNKKKLIEIETLPEYSRLLNGEKMVNQKSSINGTKDDAVQNIISKSIINMTLKDVAKDFFEPKDMSFLLDATCDSIDRSSQQRNKNKQML